ncbi:MAG: hypothetical protein ACAI37_09085, partial [Chthoniobacter sp.]
MPRLPMSSNMSQESYDQPSFFFFFWCLIFIVAVVLLVVGGFLFARYMIFSTPLPYRIVAKMIEKANPGMRIDGLTGDLKSGLNVSSITWGQVPGSPSEITGLRIRYNGYGDAGKTHRIVINEAGVKRAHIDLADLPSATSTTTQTTVVSPGTTTTTTVDGGTTTTTTTTSGPSSGTYTSTSTFSTRSSSSAPTLPNGIDSIEVEKVDIEDVLITNRNNPEFRVSIPKIEWTGFKMTQTTFEPGVLTVESDRLSLHTESGRKVQVDGQDVAFQKLLKGIAQPALHPAIKKPIPFAADLSFLPQGDVRPAHILMDDGKLEINVAADGSASVRARQVDLASYIDPKKMFGAQAADLPSEVVLSAAAAPGFSDGNGSMKILGGSFRLGASTFQIQPLEF